MIQQLLKTNSRAKLLLSELDTRYRKFAAKLPAPLDAMAMQKASFVSASGDETFQSLSNMNPLIACSAWLFWEVFEDLSDEEFVHIAESGVYLALASGVMDKLVDGQAESPEHFALLHQALFEKSGTGFRKVFSTDSGFWRHFDRLNDIYWRSLLEETECQRSPELMTFQNFTELTGGKVSPILITLVGLAEKLQRRDAIDSMELSLRSTFVAGQIHDDILDWQIDLDARHVTYFLTQLAALDKISNKQWPSISELRATNEAKWLDVEFFSVAIDWYLRAMEYAEHLHCKTWLSYLREYQSEARRHQEVATASHIRNLLDEQK